MLDTDPLVEESTLVLRLFLVCKNGGRLINTLFSRLLSWARSDSHIKRVLVRSLEVLGLYRTAINFYFYLSAKLSGKHPQSSAVHLLNQYLISRETWFDRFETIKRFKSLEHAGASPSAASSKEPKIAVIVSLYRSGQFLDQFISNMSSQSAFNESEFCVIAVSPTDFERQRLTSWSNLFSNVRVVFHDLRVPIYEAWNEAIKMTSAPLITNANVDDLRSLESLAIQIAAAEQHPGVDVFYQDVYLSLSPEYNWPTVVAINARTRFPTISFGTLLKGQNYPHNAPAWRRELHSQLGYFEEKYSSAADAEFWLRCASADKLFLKLNEMHVAYYLNPEGISTAPDSKGALEFHSILKEYHEVQKAKLQKIKSVAPATALDSTDDLIDLIKRIKSQRHVSEGNN